MRSLIGFLLLVGIPISAGAQSAQFVFGNHANGLEGVTDAVLTEGDYSLALVAGPSGAIFNERNPLGIGVDARTLPGVTGGGGDALNIIQGDPPLAGQPEFLTMSFDRDGVITAIDFDGVKDESLEYFILTTESGARVNFFDSAANTSVPGAVDNAINDGVITGEVVYLLEEFQVFDDETFGLSIPFSAGELITLTYSELGQEYGPIDNPNGARFQGITVTVPEPSVSAMLAAALLTVAVRGRSRS